MVARMDSENGATSRIFLEVQNGSRLLGTDALASVEYSTAQHGPCSDHALSHQTMKIQAAERIVIFE